MIKRKVTYYSLFTWFVVCTSFFLLYACVPAKKAEGPQKVAVKKCLDCHQEFKTKFSEGFIHAPVKDESCYSCHRPHGLYGKIVFRADQPGLCYACHGAVKPDDSARSIHKPFHTDKCTICHDPHNSNYNALLRSDGDESCFTCHEKETFQRKLVHQPVAKGCDTCHDPHSSVNVSLLQQSPDATCKSCHNVAEQEFSKVHFAYPVTTGCIQCHTPHSAEKKGLLKVNVHEPVRKGECDSCHRVDSNKNITIKGKVDSLCLECHDIHPEAKSVHQPYTQGKCTACHAVHASDYIDLFVEAPEKVCLNCHAVAMGLQPESEIENKETDKEDKPVYKPLSWHKPVTEGKCLDCHKGHTSDQAAMLSQSVETLCYKCHAQNEYTATSGSHPPGENQNCDTCHAPHDSPERALLKGGSQRDLCYSCHKSTSSERGKFSLHKPFSRGECGKCHQLHRPQKSGYLIKSYDTGELCLSCHESVTNSGENYTMHDPVSKGMCKKCHSPHAADNEHVMLLPAGEQCYICHQDVKKLVASRKVKHQPVESGNCTACHSAHGSAQEAILKKNQPALCITCHVDVARDWLEGYPHKPAVKSCLTCHASHGSDLPSVLVKPSGSLCMECHEINTDNFLKAHGQIKAQPESCISCHNPHGSRVKSMLYPIVHSPFEEGTCAPCHPGGKK